MWSESLNPYDQYHNQKYLDNFKEEQKQKKEFMDSIKKIADSAEEKADSAERLANASNEIANAAKIQSEIASKQSKKADIKGWISVIIAFLAFILELCGRLGLF